MTEKTFLSSLARIADFDQRTYDVSEKARASWSTGDYVCVRVRSARGELARIELTSGRMAKLGAGDLVIGALGTRQATLEAVGSWKHVGDDGRMEMLTSAGLLGRLTSMNFFLPQIVSVDYVGHLTRGGRVLRMRDFAKSGNASSYDRPTVLIIGTSMSAGKTHTARKLIRELHRAGRRVVGAKLTGAGRYQDILAMSDSGAEKIFDFVDVGLPSTILPGNEFRPLLRNLLGLIQDEAPEIVVAEAGASPMEPYNGDTVMAELSEHITGTILCASDPYAVMGVMKGFQIRPDLVCGLATSTTAGVELIERFCGVRALNLSKEEGRVELASRIEALVSAAAPQRT